MAQYPCSFCGQRYHGAQQTAYPAVVDGTARMSERVRLCPDDFARLVNLPWLSLVDGDGQPAGSGCTVCGEGYGRWAIFVPYYEAGQERADLYGRACGGPCLRAALRALFGPSKDPEALWRGLEGDPA